MEFVYTSMTSLLGRHSHYILTD